MHVEKLAENLISAANVSEINFLLSKYRDLADLKLAFALKEICYQAWTKEPTKARKASKALEMLAKFTPQKKILGLANWVAGIAKLTEGKLERTIRKLQAANNIFLQLDEKHLAAQTQVSKLYALALLGRYDEAITCGKEALVIFESHHDYLAAGKIEKNLGNIVSRQEKHFDAEKYYLAAYKRFRTLNNDEELTMCENGLAITYSALNNFRVAEKYYRKALIRAKKLAMHLTQAEIEASMGNLYLFRAKFDQALNLLELSRQKYEKLQMPHQSAVAELEIADIYLELNLVSEAFEIYERLTEKLQTLKMQGEEARARVNFGRAAIHLGKNELAKNELEKAARLFASEKNFTGEAFVNLIETELAFSQQDLLRAEKLSEKASKMLKSEGNVRYTLFSKWLHGEILLGLKRYSAAESLFNETLRQANRDENLYIAQNSQASLGKIALKKGEVKLAEKHFAKAIRMIESMRNPLPAEDFRIAFFADRLLSYQSLANIYLNQGRLAKAFRLVERSRSRVLVESLSENRNFGGTRNKETQVLTRELADTREELNWFYNRLNRATVEESRPLLAETQKRERKINEMMRQIKSLEGKISGFEDTLRFGELRKSLGKTRILLEFVSFGGVISAFVVTDNKLEFVEGLASESEIFELLESLHFQFETMRYGNEKLGLFAADLKKRSDFSLQRLYEKLFLKLEELIGNRNLVIVPFGGLHYLPFHALFDGERYVIEKREVSYAPSATVLQHCLKKAKRPIGDSLLIGFADEGIPFVTEEVKRLKKVLSRNLSFTGSKATFANFRKHAEKFSVIHLACHGQFRNDNPMFSSLRLADGFLTVRDIGELNLNADLVVLSACETGLNKVLAGDELLGLTRGFLSAGAASLILTLWTVNDRAAQELIVDFYRDLIDGGSTAGSIRKAQCNLIQHKSHPYYWSPFFLTGRW